MTSGNREAAARNVALAALVFCGLVAATPAAEPAPAIDFGRDIRPVLERSCYGCHGPEKQKNGYRLDQRQVALRGGDSGKPAIVPHNAKASPLIRYISGEDEEMVMPPRKSQAPRLTAAEIQRMRDWIDAGPAWPDALAGASSDDDESIHWSLRPLAAPPVPKSPADPARPEHPIDAFVRARLASRNLTPSPEADRRTLIRRLSLDLTGLPPAPNDVDAFVADPDPQAYERLVSRLLNSPRYGERWARHWLDAIHFADSHGYEHDLGRDQAWRYRDYVIEALNGDTPWDRFIREQLAADVFYPEQTALTPALGFLGAGTFDMSTYATAPVTFDYLDRDDLVTQTMAAFVSTTANCARCHAHKFDPISQEDYYSLQAVFAGVLKGEVSYDADPAVARQRKRWTSLLAAAGRQDAAVVLDPEHAAAVDRWITTQGSGARWAPLDLISFVSVEGATLTRVTNDVVLAAGSRPDKDTYSITARSAFTNVTAIRLDVLAHESLPKLGPGRADNGNLHLSEFDLRAFAPGATSGVPVGIRRATADFNQEGWDISRALDGNPTTAWGIHPAEGQAHYAVFELAETLALPPGAHLSVTVRQVHGGSHLIGAFRLSVTDSDPARAVARPPEVDVALATPSGRRTREQQIALASRALEAMARDTLARLPTQAVVFAAAPSVQIISGDPPRQVKSLPEPKVVHILRRGAFDQPGAVARPGALSALHHLPARFDLAEEKKEGARRAALADWIAHPDNVLTWRSIVNRVWHHHFGRGLCDTPSDFGKMGGAPSHPELIDWLAVWFRDEAKGSLKQLHRLIVTSATYRQASAQRDEAARIDGENRLLWRQNRQRLDADSVRDGVLAVAGALDLKMGGPAVQHFKQSKGPQVTPALDYTAYDWSAPGAGRRSIYRYVWRGIADPFMESLDFPDLGLLAPVRGFSASSLQALTLYNNDFMLHQSGVLAARVTSEAGDVDGRVTRAIALAWQRAPRADERRRFGDFVQAHGLPALCRVLFNSNEFLFVD